ncbi:hypothetical protein [Actinoplanes sp. NPDC049681]|uniref:hypothetical protein n=1 Tax=Actinoplanes sp. NPDC049681 TaxID=3363905 RepID=UPI0037AD5502
MLASTLPVSARMRRRRRGALIAALGLAVVLTFAWRSVVPPAAASVVTEPVAASACYAEGRSEGTYLEAGIQVTGTRVSADGARAVSVTARAAGAAHGCGTAGRAQQTPTIAVALEFRLTGERLCHPDTVDSDEKCSSDRRELTVTHTHSCTNEQACELSSADETLTANVDGRIARLEARSIVTNGGDIRPATSAYQVVISG